jgi:hypothetical protein
VSTGAHPEPDEADPADAVTAIMPVIAPWPAAGAEPPAPATPWFAAPDAPIRGVATVDVAAATDADQTLVGVVVVVDDAADRPGPVTLEADSWDAGAAPAALPDQTVLRRRVGRRSPKVWVAVGVVLAALISAVALPFVLDADDEAAAPVAAGLPTALDQPPQISESSGAGPTPIAPIATAAAATPSPSVSPAAQPTAQTSAPGQPAPTQPRPTTNQPPAAPPPFNPVSFEAEGGTRSGSATVWDGYPSASGGRLVRNIGNWGGTPGTLRINNVNIPTTGSYTITIYYVHPDGEANRSATVSVSGNPALNVNFSGNQNCCQAKVLSNITIAAGPHTITIANPNGHAPSIDRVVVSPQ